MKLRSPASKITIVIIVSMMTFVSANLNWGKNNWVDILESDARGYYAYLPAIFIYHDLNFEFFDKIEGEKYYNKNLYYDYRYNFKGKNVNRYYCGTAVAELPFFLVAHMLTYLFHFDMDGYSKLYPIWMNVAALFYMFIGLVFLRVTLSLYHVDEKQKPYVLMAAVFGTNLFYYTVGEPGMSHVFSFAFISMFIYLSKKYFLSYEKKYILWLFGCLGMIVLIRPVNGLVIFLLPFTAGNFQTLRMGILAGWKNKIPLITGCFFFLVMVSIQLIIYKISTGSFYVYSYGDIGFDFGNPHMTDILFSYKKGLFLYTPEYFISLAGGYYLWKFSKFEFYSWFGFFILITYVFSSWWKWYYGGSFSSRVFVEYISLFMILLGIALNNIKSKSFQLFYKGIVVMLIIFCQLQTYQYRYYQIHWSEMTKEKYWDVFLRLDRIIK